MHNYPSAHSLAAIFVCMEILVAKLARGSSKRKMILQGYSKQQNLGVNQQELVIKI